jgi:hypothetical protein
MKHNGAFVRKAQEAHVDYAAHDPASVEWSLFGKSKGSWKSNKASRDSVIPRVQTHAFDPYTQARPDLYTFQRDAKEAVTYYAQTRLDGKFIGTVETTALGNPRESILRIFWKKNGGADLSFDMVGNRTDAEPICSGYCKKTDLGSMLPGHIGKFGWVAVATKLHGKDLRASQTEHLFSLPLFEAIATGCAFGIYKEDSQIRELHPTLGTMAPAGIGNEFEDSLHGEGVERWLRADPADMNSMHDASNHFKSIDTPGFVPGKVLEVTPMYTERAVGAVYPLKRGNDTLKDGMRVDRIIIGEHSVSYKDHPELNDINKYEVLCFSKAFENAEVPIAAVNVLPVAVKQSDGKLAIEAYAFVPKVGSLWGVDEAREEVTQAQYDLVTSEVAAWDPNFQANVETAMYKLHRGETAIAVA